MGQLLLLARPRANRKHRLLWRVHATSRSCKTQTPFTRAKKIGTARQIFGTVPRLLVPCHITCGTDTFTRRKLGVLCLKIVSTVPKIWRAVPIFLGQVNGVSVCLATRKHLLSHERMSLPLKQNSDLWT